MNACFLPFPYIQSCLGQHSSYIFGFQTKTKYHVTRGLAHSSFQRRRSMAQKLVNRWNYLNSFVRCCIKENFQVFHTRQFGRTRYRIQCEIQQFVFLTLQLHHIPILFAKEYFWLLPQPVIIARLNREMCSLPLPFNNHLCFYYYYYYYLFSIHLNLWEILLTNQCCPKLSLVLVVHTSIRRGKGVVGRSN